MDKENFTSTEIKQKALIREFVATTNMFISEYCVEVLEEKLRLTQVFFNICGSWTSDDKDEIMEELYDLELAIFDRIQDLNPEAVVD